MFNLSRVIAVAIIALGFAVAGPASAQSGQTISQKLIKPINEIQTLLDQENYQGAISQLRQIGNVSELGAYDQAVINQFYAQAYLGQDNYEEGVKYLERVLAVGRDTLPPEQIKQVSFNIGQLYIAVGASKDGTTAQNYFKRGIDTLEKWFADNPNARPDAYATLAQAYLQVQPANYNKAIQWLERTIEKAQELGEEPKEGWYRNLSGLYLEVNQPQKSLPINEFLVKTYPKRDYWMQLAYVYGELNRDRDQFATLQAAHRQGLLTNSNEQVYLAQLYIQNEIPIKGAEIIEDGMESGAVEKKADNYRLLADALYTAKELDRAIRWYNVAGEMSEGAEPFFFLGQIFLQKEDWEKAAEAFESTIRKNASAPQAKKLRMIGNAHYNLGVAYFYQAKCDSAKRAFTNATQWQDQRTGANQWISRINSGMCGA